ncbi:hypothetical protein N8I77_003381 [Diaporthe amygdali]|uniref:Uncharacterized protein n=1 Tax=Phomopsis amygdali TaxID=1214568 RepID=A0AAD9SL94_PHOAM|nr:hypothetical protein N8I77_003381 [Diaporthe amygdali]
MSVKRARLAGRGGRAGWEPPGTSTTAAEQEPPTVWLPMAVVCGDSSRALSIPDSFSVSAALSDTAAPSLSAHAKRARLTGRARILTFPFESLDLALGPSTRRHLGRAIIVGDIWQRDDLRVQDPVVDRAVVEDGLAAAVLRLRHLQFTLHDDLLDAALEHQRLDSNPPLLANSPHSPDGLRLHLWIQHGADEVDSRRGPHV